MRATKFIASIGFFAMLWAGSAMAENKATGALDEVMVNATKTICVSQPHRRIVRRCKIDFAGFVVRAKSLDTELRLVELLAQTGDTTGARAKLALATTESTELKVLRVSLQDKYKSR